jgi:hypothetical protein
VRPVVVVFRKLLEAANCSDGDALVVAECEIRLMAAEKLVGLRFAHRDPSVITGVDLERVGEARFYAALGQPSPTEKRIRLATIFRRAAFLSVPGPSREGWEKLCCEMAEAAANGGSVAPFSRGDDGATEELLRASAELLNWPTESLLRFASCQIFKNSKRLEEMRGSIEKIIGRATNKGISSLSELGILDNPRSCLFSGPILLHFPEGLLDLCALRAPLTLSKVDLDRCERIDTPALRFCTIENPTTFHELAKLRGNTLLACTDGYAGVGSNSALLAFMAKLPAIEKYHFGDSDPAGFDILARLRERSGLQIHSMQMVYRPAAQPEPLSDSDPSIAQRVLASKQVAEAEKLQVRRMLEAGDKGIFEQEMLGIPPLPEWPFYL